jgi:DNA-binding transcriptional LysR family regulator
MLDSRFIYVVAVARSGSFTAAAQATGLTQSAITRSVADLEKEIGYAVFYRTPRGVILTERGGDFVTRVGRLLEDARELLKGGAAGADPYDGVIRIGVCPASLEWWLVEPLVELLSKHAGVRYDISSSNFETIVQHLRSGTLDVAVGFDAAFAEWPDLRRESMGSLKANLFVRKGHPLEHKDNITQTDLARYNFVTPSDSRPYGEIIRDLYKNHGIDWHDKVHRADFFPAVRRIVETTDAIGTVAVSYASSPQFLERFAVLSNIDLFPVAPLCCAVRMRWQPKAATRAFINMVKRRFPVMS